jgi:hypothetical protein
LIDSAFYLSGLDLLLDDVLPIKIHLDNPASSSRDETFGQLDAPPAMTFPFSR